MSRGLCAFLLAWATLGLAREAAATTGGDTRAEVLGWDVKAQTVFWTTSWGGEGTQLEVFSQTLAAGSAPVHLRKLSTEDEALAARRVSRLRKHLAALPRVKAKTVALETRVDQKRHVVLHQTDARTRYRLHVRVTAPGGRTGEIDLVAYRSPRVRVASAAALPDGKATVVVLRFLGDPAETGYDVDAVVLARAP